MGYHIRKLISLLSATALLGVCLLGILFSSAPALAAIRQLEETPGQFVYQSRQGVQDQQGDRWQVIAFNRVRPDGSTSFYVRLVGFPGSVDIDRSRPLILTPTVGESFTAEDASSQIFTDASAPESNVGQYDLQPLVADLPTAIPMQMTLPVLNQEDRLLPVSPSLIQEWKTVAAYD
ncbi:MAG: DUF3122 domain-containing protein [Synechococcales cyanobacterium T60_A2020_003]|nr:DUF3122 domain-containing protein [Synechococcales cyanobacterium T60_A2020_003]